MAPKDYALRNKSVKDKVIEVKKEQLSAMSRTIGLLTNELNKNGPIEIDLTEEDIIDSVQILLDADDDEIDDDIAIVSKEKIVIVN